MSVLDPPLFKCQGVGFNLQLQGLLPEKFASPSWSKRPPLQPSTNATTSSSTLLLSSSTMQIEPDPCGTSDVETPSCLGLRTAPTTAINFKTQRCPDGKPQWAMKRDLPTAPIAVEVKLCEHNYAVFKALEPTENQRGMQIEVE